MSHTQTPWVAFTSPAGGRYKPHVKGADSSPAASCGGNAPGYGAYTNETQDRQADNAERIAAAVNFFHSKDRQIPTDKIAVGGFWEMVELLGILAEEGCTCGVMADMKCAPCRTFDLFESWGLE